MEAIEKLETIIKKVESSNKYKNKKLILNFLENKLLKVVYEN